MTPHRWVQSTMWVENVNGDRFERVIHKCPRCAAIIPVSLLPNESECGLWAVDPDCDAELVRDVMGA